MKVTQAVGIDLGTTYSCIAYLNEHGEPITLANEEGELSTPSVVLFDGGDVLVGTEALRNSIVHPDRVVQNSKRFIGDPNHRWTIDGRPYSPVDIATFILKKLVLSAQRQIGPIEQAIISVPAQFTDGQRHATIEAGHNAGLQKVEIINEPVAAALCYVLGSEGLWFTELADEQNILVYDLGGGTFDLSLVRYRKNEVQVIVSSGDLNLGGIDWNHALEKRICDQFIKKYKKNPRNDPSSMQALALEVEQTKRSLSVRPSAGLTFQHGGHRKVFQIEIDQFERLTRSHVERTAEIILRLLKDNNMGWAHVDVVRTTGGASRMPMIRKRLKEMSGRTLNTTLSPDLSIAHGATYYAGMLLSNDQFARSILNPEATERLSQIKQQSVNARGLGVLVRDAKRDVRFPHYLIPANSTLPTSITQMYGTVIPNQRNVRLHIVESGTSPEAAPAVLGVCEIDDLPSDLPVNSEIEVTISYDASACVHVSAKDVSSGKNASIDIIRQENLVAQLVSNQPKNTEVTLLESPPKKPVFIKPKAKEIKDGSKNLFDPEDVKVSSIESDLEEALQIEAFCNTCGKQLDSRGHCLSCSQPTGDKKQIQRQSNPIPKKITRRQPKAASSEKAKRPDISKKAPTRSPKQPPLVKPSNIVKPSKIAKSVDDEIPSDDKAPTTKNSPPRKKKKSKKLKRSSAQQTDKPSGFELGEDEFWQLVD